MQNTLLPLFMMLFFLQPSNIENEIENLNPVVVLELFTSQGCSSCPSADVLLKKVSKNDKSIIALSYHVDYWNYIGWKDPFAKAEFTKKQRAYSAKFYSNTIYTPQTVINGKEHFVGSKVSVMNEKLKQYKKIDSKNKIELLEATNPDSPIAKFLEKKGEGIHHIAYDVDNIETELKRLEAEGFVVLNKTPKKGADNKLVAFLHPKSTNGVLIELCQEIR